MRLIWIALTASTVVACSAGTGSDQAQQEGLTTTQEALTSCASASASYTTADIVFNDIKLQSASSNFCWATKFSGEFDGDQADSLGNVGQGVEPENDGFWHLVYNQDHGDGNPEARCVPLSCFTGDGVNDVVWVSTFENQSALATADSSCDAQTTYNGWWGDAATILRFWPGPGETNGSGENVQVIQSSNAFSNSGIQAADCDKDGLGHWIAGRSVSLFAGTPSSGQLAMFTGSDFVVSGNYTLNLGVHTDEAICYFTQIYGKFRGGGESLRLYQVADGSRFVWYARSTQGSGGKQVKGVGKCFYYNQSNK